MFANKCNHSAVPSMMLASGNNQTYTPPIFSIAANLQQGSFSITPTNFPSPQTTTAFSVNNPNTYNHQSASLSLASAGFNSAIQQCATINNRFTQVTFVPINLSIGDEHLGSHDVSTALSQDVTMELAMNVTPYSVSGTRKVSIAPHININLRLGPIGEMHAYYAMATVDGVYRAIVESTEFVKDCLVIGFRKDLRDVFGRERANPWIAKSKQNMQFKLDGMKNLGMMLAESMASVQAGNTAARLRLLGVNNGVVNHFENISVNLMNDAYQRSGYEQLCQLSSYEQVARVTQFITGLAIPYFVNKAVGACINKHRYGSFRKSPFYRNNFDNLQQIQAEAVNLDRNFIVNIEKYLREKPLYDITKEFYIRGNRRLEEGVRILSNGEKNFFYNGKRQAFELMYTLDVPNVKAHLSTGLPDGKITCLTKHPELIWLNKKIPSSEIVSPGAGHVYLGVSQDCLPPALRVKHPHAPRGLHAANNCSGHLKPTFNRAFEITVKRAFKRTGLCESITCESVPFGTDIGASMPIRVNDWTFTHVDAYLAAIGLLLKAPNPEQLSAPSNSAPDSSFFNNKVTKPANTAKHVQAVEHLLLELK